MTARERATLNRMVQTDPKDMDLFEYVALMSRALTVLAKDFVAHNDAVWTEEDADAQDDTDLS